MTAHNDSRRYVSEMSPKLVKREDGKLELTAPAVGLWRDAPAPGSLVAAGQSIGSLEVLGRLHRLVAPHGTTGVVVSDAAKRSRAPVDFGTVLLTLDPEVSGAAASAAADGDAASTSSGGLVFRSPTSGRFYAKPSPDKPNFVEAGDVIETGQPVALLEVMKTFNRVQYGGGGLPARVKVLRIVPDNESDVEAGDPLLELEPA